MTEFRPGRFEILPPVIKNLLIINGLFFLAQTTFSGNLASSFSFEDQLALHSWQSELFKPWQLITHMFLHGDFYHVFGNMFALWMFGAVLENIWGSGRFLTFYLVCGFGAALIHLFFLNYELSPLINDYKAIAQHYAGTPSYADALVNFGRKNGLDFAFNDELIGYLQNNSGNTNLLGKIQETITAFYEKRINVATLGASGAVFGILAAFVYLFPNTYIYIYFLIPVKAKWLGLVYFSYELFLALQNSAGDNVARWAHIGGAIVGLLIVLTWNKRNKKTFY